LLFENDPAATWQLVWPILGTDREFAKEFFVALARTGRPDYTMPSGALAEWQLEELFIRLSEIFPHEKDRLVSGLVGPDDEGRMLRDSVQAELVNRGTPAACGAVASIAQRLPTLPWFKWVLLEANQARRRNTSNWPRPRDVLKIASDKSRRFVQDAAGLLDVVTEALANLESELQSETPAARDLWDKKTGSRSLYLPRPEEDISDYVKRYLDRALRDRGIVINREVRIHRGQRTDVHVDAVAEGEGGVCDVATVIVEVKGCWNPELLTAMKSQLVDKYLTDNRCRYGAYLVFWFDGDLWDPDDPRRKTRPRLTSMEELKALLVTQAAELPGFSVRPLVLDARLKR
jgi:hypothetical protein